MFIDVSVVLRNAWVHNIYGPWIAYDLIALYRLISKKNNKIRSCYRVKRKLQRSGIFDNETWYFDLDSISSIAKVRRFNTVSQGLMHIKIATFSFVDT